MKILCSVVLIQMLLALIIPGESLVAERLSASQATPVATADTVYARWPWCYFVGTCNA